MKRLVLSVSVLALSAMLGACTPLGLGVTAGSAAGVAAASEGGIKSSLSDAGIKARINDLWFRHDLEMFRKLNMTVNQGRVLLTGVVQKPEHRVEAVRLAWEADGVQQVINEIKVADSEGIPGWARDVWISGRLRSGVLFDKNVQSVNYSFDTVQSVVYVMGIAQNQAELDRVVAHARSISYVKDVVSYVKFAGVPVGEVIVPQTGSGRVDVTPIGGQAPVYNSYEGQTGVYQDYNYVRDTQTGVGGHRPQPIPGDEF